MPALFEISQEMTALYDSIADADGEITPEIDAFITHLISAEAEKLGGFYYCIKKAGMEEAAATAMKEQWAKKSDSRRKLGERLKEAVLAHLIATGQQKIVTPDGNTFAVQKNGGKKPLIVKPELDLHEVDPMFLKQVISIDTDVVRECLDNGDLLTFAEYGPTGNHLRLR